MRSEIMKAYRLFLYAIFFIIPLPISAGWQVLQPGASVPREPFFQAGGVQENIRVVAPSTYSGNSFPGQYSVLGQPAAMYAVSICGSLKENIERIMGRYHWRVVWKAGYDYNFDGRVTGSSLQNVIQKLLRPFPLQAVMYMSNRTLVVLQRPRFKEVR